jgi:hypothetical protein
VCEKKRPPSRTVRQSGPVELGYATPAGPPGEVALPPGPACAHATLPSVASVPDGRVASAATLPWEVPPLCAAVAAAVSGHSVTSLQEGTTSSC